METLAEKYILLDSLLLKIVFTPEKEAALLKPHVWLSSVNTIDYICGSLLIHYMSDNTKMIEVACLVIILTTQYICIMQLLQFIKIINNKH